MRLALFLLFAAAPTLANPSARSTAMGDAFTAVGDDVSGMTFNPANTGQVREPQGQASFLRLRHEPAGVIDREQINAAGVWPIQQEIIRGGIGLLYSYEDRNPRAAREGGLNYATRGLFEFEQGGVELGSTIKAGRKKELDLGVLARWKDRTKFGFSLLNFGGPGPDSQMRIGAAEQVRGLTLAMDMTRPTFASRTPSSFGAGLERWWPTARRGAFAGRAGLRLSKAMSTVSAGTGWRILGGQLDFSTTIPLRGTQYIGYAVTTLFRFGASDPEREYERMLSQEIGYRKDLTQALEAGEVKQWRLAEELRKLRDEMELLRDQLVDKTASEAEARARLRELEQRRREAAAQFEKIQADRKKTRDALYKEDWQAYQRLKLSGAPDSVLLDNVRRMLREYKDSGADLSEANQELLRLLRAQPAQ